VLLLLRVVIYNNPFLLFSQIEASVILFGIGKGYLFKEPGGIPGFNGRKGVRN